MTQASEQRREQIVATARAVVDELGPSRLTAEAITREIGVSRPLLYHYFENMGDLLDAVMDIYLDEFEQRLNAWEHGPAREDADWTASLVRLLRPTLVDECPLRIDAAQGANGSCYGAFVARCATVLACHAERNAQGAWEPCAQTPCLHEAVRYALYGLTGVLTGFPELSDEDAARLVAGSLGIERSQDTTVEDHTETTEAQPEATSPKKGLLGWIFG